MATLPEPHAVAVVTVPAFYRPLDVEYIDGRLWRLCAPFTYGSVILERVVEIAAGFVTDFASIPRALWAVFPPTGTYGKAAVVHDYLYHTTIATCRAQADSVFYEAMTELGVGFWTRHLMYRAVRLAGAGAYHPAAARD